MHVYAYINSISIARSKKMGKIYIRERRYGFNSMSKDNKLYGEGNAYDFGARIYDPRIGRFLSIDPEYADNAHESNYSYAANNPILFVDLDGGNNYVYIVLLPGSETKISRAEMRQVVNQINQTNAKLGIDTRVKLLQKNSIDPTKLDKNDSYVLVGSPEEIHRTVSNADGTAKKGFEDLHSVIKTSEWKWSGGEGNPEESALGNFYEGNKKGDHPTEFKKGGAIDPAGLMSALKNRFKNKLTKTEVFALTILHGLGHNTGGANIGKMGQFGGSNVHVTYGIGMDVNRLQTSLENGMTYDDITAYGSQNKKYVEASQNQMGMGCPVDNYDSSCP